MFARIKKSGQYEYLQIVQNRREGTKTIQRVVATIGRMDELRKKDEIENLVRSLSRFSEKVLFATTKPPAFNMAPPVPASLGHEPSHLPFRMVSPSSVRFPAEPTSNTRREAVFAAASA